MAKQRTEDAPPAALWKDTFSDLMNLLLCFFVLLFAMSTVDSQKFEEIAASLSSSFSVLPQGGSAISKEGILVSSGASQLNDLSTFYNNMGLNNDGNMSQDIQNAYDEIEKEGLEQSESMAQEIKDKLTASGVADQIEVTAYSKYVMLNVNGGILFALPGSNVKQKDFSAGKLKYWKGANFSPLNPSFLFSTNKLYASLNSGITSGNPIILSKYVKSIANNQP